MSMTPPADIRTAETFETAFSFMLQAEGIEQAVAVAGDSGGLTKYGISQASYPDVDIRNITLDHAKAIYRQDYWSKLRCAEMPAPVAIALFDAGVNLGITRAAQQLQRAVLVAQDGIVGDETVRAANKLPVKNTLIDMMWRRCTWYALLATQDETQGRFLMGWYRRCIQLHTLCLALMWGHSII